MTSTQEPTDESQDADFGPQIASLLQGLSAVQTDLLALLAKKQRLVAARDDLALQAMRADEQQLADRLQACCQQRQQLLRDADQQGMPATTITELAKALPETSRNRVAPTLRDARRQTRLVQHQSLANWVLVQRSLLHLSQMMEIIATGGRLQPTYGREPHAVPGGALVDQAV